LEEKLIISKVLGHYHEGDSGERLLDSVLMTHDQLLKPHQKVRTALGRNLGISLDEQQSLFDGAVLWQDDQVVVVIKLVEEDVLEIRPFGNEEWAKIAFNIGNMHHSAYLYPTFIRVSYDPIVERMLSHLGAPVERKMARLDGERANAPAGHSHTHNDEHTHAHNEDHNHEG
jgi:urease accessory protein